MKIVICVVAVVSAVLSSVVLGDTVARPSDCVIYSIEKHPHQTVTKTFTDRVRLSTRVSSVTSNQESWDMKIHIKELETNKHCTFDIHAVERVLTFDPDLGRDRNNAQKSRIVGYCSSWNSSYIPNISVDIDIIEYHHWSHMLLGLNQYGTLVLMLAKSDDVQFIELFNSGLEGSLLIEFETNEDTVDVMFDCVSGCELRFGGKESHNTVGDHFYYWRTSEADSLSYRAFPRSYGYIIDIVQDEPVLEGVNNWITVSTDVINRTFVWSFIGSQNTTRRLWTDAHIHSYDDISQGNVEILVPDSGLVSNCHPYQLPCPDDPFHCYLAEKRYPQSSFSRLFETVDVSLPWFIFGILLLVIIVLLCVVCGLRRRIKRIGKEEIFPFDYSKQIGNSATPLRFNKEEETPIYNDFNSGEAGLAHNNSVRYTTSPGGLAGNIGNTGPRRVMTTQRSISHEPVTLNEPPKRDSELYYNMPRTYENFGK